MTDIMKKNLWKMLEEHLDCEHQFNNTNIYVTAWNSDSAGYGPVIEIHSSKEKAIKEIYDILLEGYIDELDWACNRLDEDYSFEDFKEEILETLGEEGFYYNFR